MEVSNELVPSGSRMKEFFSAKEDGPFVMVNLLKFRQKAEYSDDPDCKLTGAEAYSRYSKPVADLVRQYGGAANL